VQSKCWTWERCAGAPVAPGAAAGPTGAPAASAAPAPVDAAGAGPPGAPSTTTPETSSVPAASSKNGTTLAPAGPIVGADNSRAVSVIGFAVAAVAALSANLMIA
jgi:hypothetical protein